VEAGSALVVGSSTMGDITMSKSMISPDTVGRRDRSSIAVGRASTACLHAGKQQVGRILSWLTRRSYGGSLRLPV
jgi:hypothetical protein